MKNKITIELEVGPETAVVVMGLETLAADLKKVATVTDNTTTKLFSQVSDRLAKTIRAKVDEVCLGA